MRTKTVLINDLLAEKQTPMVEYIISKAKQGYYHDFETPIATPKIQLSEDLSKAGLNHLKAKVIRGDYD